ncbi:hypothetical protein EBZ39_02230 [bacterium]|nr:hypothetical protein [bacterium]
MANRDELSIKLHVADNDRVWYVKGIGVPIDSGKTVEEFLLSPIISGMSLCVRLIGCRNNAELISELFMRKYRGELQVVQLAGPQYITNEEFNNPKLVLLKMRTIQSAPSCGGWHDMSLMDHSTYAMANSWQKNNAVIDASVLRYYQFHPARKALKFIHTLSEAATIGLLVSILDPRWFVDLRRPERSSKLELYLGLSPKTQQSVSDKKRIICRPRELRCATVLSCWKTANPADVDVSQPNNFLYRIYAAAGGGSKGDLRASQAFVRYLRHNWLAALDTRKGKKDSLFAPDIFFKSQPEISAYLDYMAVK